MILARGNYVRTFSALLLAALAGAAHAAQGDDPLARLGVPTGDPVAFYHRVADAVNNHPAVQEALAGHGEAQQRTREYRSQYLPTLDFSINTNSSLSRQFEDVNGNRIESIQPRSRIDSTLSAQQLLFDFGATSHRIRGSVAREGAAEQEVNATATEIAQAALEAHAQLAMQLQLKQMGDVFIERHRKILADTKLRFEQGYGPGGDVARVEAYLARAEGQIANIARDLASARARYKEVFNAAPPETMEVVLPFRSTASTLDEAVSMAEQRSLTVKRANALAAGATEDLAAVKADRWPRLSLGLDATKYDVFDSRINYDIRARVLGRYNIFNGGQSSARSGQAYQRAQGAQAAEARARGEAARDATIAFEQQTALEAQVATLRRAAEASNRARDFFVEQFKVARGSLLDLLQAEQDSFETMVDYARAQNQLEAARYALLARTGELLPGLGIHYSFSTAAQILGEEP